MRHTMLAMAWLLCPAGLLAAPVPSGQSPGAKPISEARLQAAARDYGQHLTQILELIESNYVRPVNRAELVERALAGLYEAAGAPVPDTLRADIKKAAPRFDALATRTRQSLGLVEGLHGRKALIASCRAMMRVLDPFCTVVTGEEAATLTGFDQRYGLGLDLVDKVGPGPLIIKAVVPGGPAQQAGLQAGDQIVLVNDKETGSLSADDALRLLNGARLGSGPDGLPPPLPAPGAPASPDTVSTPVRLAIRSRGARETRQITVVRDYFEPESVQGVTRHADNSWDYWLDRKKHIAHIRIVTLAKHTADELERVLTRLDGDDLHGLILDLRWCPGGYLDSATGAAGLFLESGIIARTTGRSEREMVYQAQGSTAHKFLHFPMVVLVNAETTGGGELIAAALQDHKRAAVAGQRTRGKGSIQMPAPMNLATEAGHVESIELKLTTGTFLRPSGKGLNRFADSKPTDDWGVRPDPKLETRVSPELSLRLREWWNEQAVRPGSSTKALPLDDPEEDPQRQAALKALVRIMAEKK